MVAIETLTGPLPPEECAPRIAGLSALKGLVLYGAIFTFAGLYIYFIVRITGARAGVAPKFDASLISTAAALAGVLGSAFALEIGTKTPEASTNNNLSQAIGQATTGKQKAVTRIWQTLSLEPESTSAASWPKTFGIWIYAIVASGVAVTYVFNQNETPPSIKALAVAFGGYVIALVTAAYKSDD
jgi:hypothetical protein